MPTQSKVKVTKVRKLLKWPIPKYLLRRYVRNQKTNDELYDTPRQYPNFNWTDSWYSSSFGVTWPSNLGRYTFGKRILRLTRRPSDRQSRMVQIFKFNFTLLVRNHCWMLRFYNRGHCALVNKAVDRPNCRPTSDSDLCVEWPSGKLTLLGSCRSLVRLLLGGGVHGSLIKRQLLSLSLSFWSAGVSEWVAWKRLSADPRCLSWSLFIRSMLTNFVSMNIVPSLSVPSQFRISYIGLANICQTSCFGGVTKVELWFACS